MVGLPARGKSFVARKIARYLRWRGHPTRIFNVGSYRRQQLGAKKSDSFFDPDNDEARRARMQVAMVALDELLAWLDRGGEVGIFDATNSTPERRAMIVERCARAGVSLTFVETISKDPDLIEANIRATKLHLPDYDGVDASEAVVDFRRRIEQYRRAYVAVEDDALSWIKLIALAGGDRKMIINRVDDDVTLRAAQLLVGFQTRERTIWLTRHGESEYNVIGRIGGDAPLSAHGRSFAANLAAWVDDRTPIVWTSTLRRTRQTAEALSLSSTAWRALDEIDAGTCEGMTYDEIREQMPDEFAARQRDKLRYRYPRGESYLDVIDRLDPLMNELERVAGPLLIIGHQAVLRAVYAYLAGKPREDCPFLEIPLHTIIELAPGGIAPREERISLAPR